MHRFNSASKLTLILLTTAALSTLTLLLNLGSTGAGAQQPNSNRGSDPDEQCRAKQDGSPCSLKNDARLCRVGRCRDNACISEPAPVGRACPDIDGSPCTIPGCTAAGTCDQKSRVRPDGTSCSDGSTACNNASQTCNAGRCVPAPGTDPSQLAPISVNDVEVLASIPRVAQLTAFNDCCGSCEQQDLEALVPIPQGTPRRLELDGQKPLRRKFCGTVAKYGVNDESADPRDIMINILPSPLGPYRDFLNGFVNTEQTRLKGNQLKQFGPSATQFNLQDCLSAARDTKNKVIHAEVTPDEHFYGADGRFLPIENNPFNCGSLPFSNINCRRCVSSWDCKSELEPSDETAGREICVYGVYAYDHGNEHRASTHSELCRVLDTDHDHPEMHPFDAIWWRHPDHQGWMFGVFQDDSNRYSFPHCGSTQNGNEWSQAPRDLTFRFPFKFPVRSAPQHACLQHVRTRSLVSNSENIVGPMNVTTSAFVSATEALNLTLSGQRVLDVTKEIGSELETHVRVEGRIVGDDVVGQIILRVAIGCDARSGVRCGRFAKPSEAFDALKSGNKLVKYDKDDPGAGYYYSQLTFDCACPSR